MLTIPIRPARPSDLRDVAMLIDRAIRISNAPEYSVKEQMAVLQDYSLPALGRTLSMASVFLVAEMQLGPGETARPAGMIAVTPAGGPGEPQTGVINGLFVDPLAQGMGLGGALIDDAVLKLRRQGVAALVVHASLSAVGFYAHVGFSRVGTGKASSGVDIVKMRRGLR
jgi:predicted N-acetyltransferase YhbS